MASSNRKRVVETYIAGFRAGDRRQILDCLTDDVTWTMSPYFNLSGKDAFAGEIQNPATPGLPAIQLTRLLEDGDIVVAEGEVQADLESGGRIDALFCDVFHFRDDRICHLTTYQVDRELGGQTRQVFEG